MDQREPLWITGCTGIALRIFRYTHSI